MVVGVGITVTVALFALSGGDAPGGGLDVAPDSERVLGAGKGAPSSAEDEGAVARPVDSVRRVRRSLRRELQAGARRAATLGGSVHAAAMLSGWEAPVVAASDPADADRAMRLWSTSKVLTAVALLREAAWDDRPGERLSPEVEEALTGALVRSENCRQRRVVLELQEATGSPEQARSELAAIVASAGADIALGSEVERPQPICRPFLETQRATADPMAPALLLGTSTWTMADAVRFANALASGRYGDAVGNRVLDLMRRPKQPSRETPPGDYTAALDWGAGRALAGFDPAFKAGWGGTLIDDFFVSQMVVLDLPDGGTASLAIAFHPNVQPSKDDPGLTPGPDAVEVVVQAVGDELGRLGLGG